MISPVLIDSRGQFKLVFWAVIFTLLVFAGGFISGYQRAAEQRRLATETLPLILPVMEADAGGDVSSEKVPETLAAGAEIDVDLPDTIAATSLELEHGNAPVSGLTAITAATASKAVEAETADTVVKPVAEKRYTIQAGTYSRLENAKIMLSQLQQQQLDAYITDYRNRKKQLRYNVRFGAFASKKNAREQLAEYRVQPGRDAYIVKYTADRIVDLAAAQKKTVSAQPQSSSPVQAAEASADGRLSRAEPHAFPVVPAGDESNHTIN